MGGEWRSVATGVALVCIRDLSYPVVLEPRCAVPAPGRLWAKALDRDATGNPGARPSSRMDPNILARHCLRDQARPKLKSQRPCQHYDPFPVRHDSRAAM